MHIYFQKDEKRNVAIQPLLDEIYELKKMKIIIDGTVGRAQILAYIQNNQLHSL